MLDHGEDLAASSVDVAVPATPRRLVDQEHPAPGPPAVLFDDLAPGPNESHDVPTHSPWRARTTPMLMAVGVDDSWPARLPVRWPSIGRSAQCSALEATRRPRWRKGTLGFARPAHWANGKLPAQIPSTQTTS